VETHLAVSQARTPTPADRRPRLDVAAFGGVVAALGATILLGVPLLPADVLRGELWAFDHLRDTPLGVRLALAALLAAAAVPRLQALAAAWSTSAARRASRARRFCGLALAAAASLPLLLALGGLRQRNYELGDGAHLIQFVTLAVHTHGFHVTYDEPLELFVHSILYRALHAWRASTVQDAYALLSALAGVGYVVVLVAFWRRRVAGARCVACGTALVASAATAQLFFGYVENYTLVTLGVVAYAWLAARVLEGRSRLVVAAAVLGTCVSFHVLAGWLLPSLAYVAWVSTRRLEPQRRARSLAAGAAALLAPPAATVALLTALGVPLDALGTTHLAHLKFIFRTPPTSSAYHYPAFSGSHLRDLANEILLVSLPGLLTIAGAALAGVRRDAWRDPLLRFLALGALFTHVFAATWNSEIGAYRDWDLFSITGLFDSLLGAYLLLSYVPARADVAAVAAPVLVLAAALTGSWISSNAHRVVAVPSHHDRAHLQAGLLARWAGNEEAARRDFEQVIRLDARNARALFELGTSLWNDGDRTNALPLLRRFLEVESGTDRAEKVRRVLEAGRAARAPR
jgi:hypothetical protein